MQDVVLIEICFHVFHQCHLIDGNQPVQ